MPTRRRSQPNYSKILLVLSRMLLLLAASFVFPLAVSLFYQDGLWTDYLMSMGLTLAVAGAGALWCRRALDLDEQERDLNIREGLLVVGMIWVMLSVFGALPFRLSGTLLSFTDAVFESTSGFTTTGATILGGRTAAGLVNPQIEQVAPSLLFWRSFTHWMGGMGIIVLSIAILPLLGVGGMKLFQAESSLLISDKFRPRVRDTAKMLWNVYALMTLTLFGLLWLDPSMDWFEAVNHAFSTMATGGFSTKNASLAGFGSFYVEMVTLVFMFLSGVNFVLHLQVYNRKPMLLFRDSEVRFYFIVVVAATLAVSLFLWYRDFYSIADSLRYGAFQVVSVVTTTGFGTDDYELWNSFSLYVLFLLFFMGGCAGSTSGGVKIFRWMVLIEIAKREFKQILHPRAVLSVRLGQRLVDNEAQRTVLSFTVLYIFLFGLGAFVMTMLDYDFISAIGASIATLGNIGPGLGEFGPTDHFAGVPLLGKWMLIGFMVIGRLEIFTVLVLFSSAFWRD